METQSTFLSLLELPQPALFCVTDFSSLFLTPIFCFTCCSWKNTLISPSLWKDFATNEYGGGYIKSWIILGNKFFLIKPRVFQNTSKDKGHTDLQKPCSVSRHGLWNQSSGFKTWLYNFLLDFKQLTSLSLKKSILELLRGLVSSNVCQAFGTALNHGNYIYWGLTSQPWVKEHW